MCQYHHHIHFLAEEVGAVREGLASPCTQLQSGSPSLKPQASQLQCPLVFQPWSTSGVTRSRCCERESMSRCPHSVPFPGRWTIEKVPGIVAGIKVAQVLQCASAKHRVGTQKLIASWCLGWCSVKRALSICPLTCSTRHSPPLQSARIHIWLLV